MKTVLSLFDGISGTQVALDRNGVKVGKYYASEIDRFAMSITHKNFPKTEMLYDINNWQDWDIDWSSIDLVVGGFPCQAWSNAGLKQGDKDPRGMLFWTMLDVMKKVLSNNPQAKFLMENVRMKKEFEDYITFHTEEALGKVNKHLINSALVSAQNRKRFYWTNIEGIDQPEDQGLVLADILIDGCVDRDKSYCIDANYHKGGNPKSYFEKGRRQLVFDRPCELRDFDSKAQCHHVANATDIKGNESIKRVYADSGKSPTLTTMGGGHREPKVLIIPQKVKVRKYEVDIPKLQKTLRDHKDMTILTNKNLADLLYVPVTKVEHWFRTDSSFAIPSEDIWFRLKDLLVIKTDEFDKSIVCFEVRDGKFDMAERVYSPDGKSPTVVSSNVSKVLCGAIRGRYIEGNSGKTEQRLEVREDQKTNALTTVQKDNVVVSVKGGAIRNQVTKRGVETQLNIRKDDKSNCVVASWSHKLNGVVEYFDDQPTYRKLSVEECEKLQTFPIGYTEGISNTQRYKCLGNSFTVSVIQHILSYAFSSEI